MRDRQSVQNSAYNQVHEETSMFSHFTIIWQTVANWWKMALVMKTCWPKANNDRPLARSIWEKLDFLAENRITLHFRWFCQNHLPTVNNSVLEWNITAIFKWLCPQTAQLQVTTADVIIKNTAVYHCNRCGTPQHTGKSAMCVKVTHLMYTDVHMSNRAWMHVNWYQSPVLLITSHGFCVV